MTKKEKILKAIADFPDHGNKTLGCYLHKTYPNTFTSEETARNNVRYYRGANGTKNRKKRNMTQPTENKRSMPLPKSKAKPRKPFQVPEGKTLFLSDIHIPYHDQKALEVALEYGDKLQPDVIYLNGDTADFFAISRFMKDPEQRNLPAELQALRQFLQHIRERFPKSLIIWKNGNHEERWEHYLWHKAPELAGVPEYEMRNILRFDEYGVEFVHGRQMAKWGKHLYGIHGHEIPGAFDPVNFARTLQTKMMVCSIGGHKHKTSQHSVRTGADTFITCYSVGCIEELHPEYMPINQWNHGFAAIELHRNDFRVSNFRIIDGKVLT